MGLFSILKRQDTPSPATGAAADQSLVANARVSARRRLIGAMVLLGLGVIAFPLIFETQPRPIPVDIPIEIPRKEGLPPLAVPAPRPAATASQPVITETRAEAPRDAVPAAAAASQAAPAVAATPPKPESKSASPAEVRPAPKAEPAAAPRAAASPEPKPAVPASEGGRFVVQVGAFAESAAVREVRAKVDKLGLSTYTQVVETAGGKRTRVRVGPFATRDEADKVAARLKAAGLPGAVLTL
ncbi:MAG TPA: SPOR domain-containing protein [Burkholderiaceae bacterium]|nr:SPOR domain-containing protein [Burkholderiaceae bacterium]